LNQENLRKPTKMSKLDTLLHKEMTREQFLLTLMAGVVSFFGLSTILGMLSKAEPPKPSDRPGYGVQQYGP
jgi:hypothetical protein